MTESLGRTERQEISERNEDRTGRVVGRRRRGKRRGGEEIDKWTCEKNGQFCCGGVRSARAALGLVPVGVVPLRLSPASSTLQLSYNYSTTLPSTPMSP